MELGQDAQTRGGTLFTKTIGLGIQKLVHKANNNTDAIKRLDAKTQSMYNNTSPEQRKKNSSLLLTNETSFKQWLQNVDHIGELEANTLLTEEVVTLARSTGKEGCNF